MPAVLPLPAAMPSLIPVPAGSFSADSDQEKEEWVEAMQQSIAEALSNSEVAERIWVVESNRFCADCGSPKPDWASINLCVVICKRCAGTCIPAGERRGRASPALARDAGQQGLGDPGGSASPTPKQVPNGSSCWQGSTGGWAPASPKSGA